MTQLYQILILIVACYLLASFCYSIYKRQLRALPFVDLKGKVAIITGASAGIGLETAKVLASHNATVIFACRSVNKTIPEIQKIKKQTNNQNLHLIELDLANYDSVEHFVLIFKKKFDRLDFLINNAGRLVGTLQFNTEGHELTFATNHLGHFLLTSLLMDVLKQTKESRVINLSSSAHNVVNKKVDFNKLIKGKYNKPLSYFFIYGATKYTNIMFTKGLNNKFQEQNFDSKAVSIHPGFVETELLSTKNKYSKLHQLGIKILTRLSKPFMLNQEEGALTTLHAVFLPYSQLKQNGYYSVKQLKSPSKFCQTSGQWQELWDFSEKCLERYL